MKHCLSVISALALLPVLASCYKDQSTVRGEVFPEITITGIEKAIFVQYGEDVTIDAHVSQIGRTDDDFEYLWEVDAIAGRIDMSGEYSRVEAGTTTHFEYKVTCPPANDPYMITFTVKDKKSGIFAIAACAMYVTSALGEGLLVGYTRDGGVTSEIDLASCESLTYGYQGDGIRYTRGVHALANDGAVIDGRVNTISQFVGTNGVSYNDPRYLVGTDKHFISFDNLTFKEMARDKGNLSITGLEEFPTTLAMPYAAYCALAVIGGDIYACTSILDNVFTKVSYAIKPSSVFGPENVSAGALDQCDLVVFNPDKGHFAYMLGWRTGLGGLGVYLATFPFSLEGSTCIGCGAGKINITATEQFHNFLIKDAKGVYRLVRVDPRAGKNEAYELDGEGLDDVVSFIACDNADICYYATGTDIYAILITGGKALTRKVNFTPQTSGEKITKLVHYKQGWYGVSRNDLASYQFQLSTNRLQILVVTHDAATGEGKIYLRPFNVSTGLFTLKDNGVLTGFGEITAVGPSMR